MHYILYLMFNIEINIIPLLAFIVIYNSPRIVKYLNIDLKKTMIKLVNFYIFICENNKLILDYYVTDYSDVPELVENICNMEGNGNGNGNTTENVNTNVTVKEIKYENKYLEKFKTFPNEYYFSEMELEDEKKEYENIKKSTEQLRFNTIREIKYKLDKIHDIQNNGNITNTGEDFTKDINEYGINKLLGFFNLREEYEDDPDDIDFEELYNDLLNEKVELDQKMLEIDNTKMSEDDFRKVARDEMIKRKLDKYIDNYILEYTPLGNIYMRYNNDKKSFEYFSNNTIPYRYLEPVGRKYVMTYWCKPLFVDIEEELKKAEEKYDEEKKREDDKKNNQKNMLVNVHAQFKNYNKDTKQQLSTTTTTNSTSNMNRPSKNRNNSNNVLPPQIQANLPDVNNKLEKQLLKENSNRYTWEGRLANFCPLKKIDKKVLDKKLSMTYGEFKKMQEQQNKK